MSVNQSFDDSESQYTSKVASQSSGALVHKWPGTGDALQEVCVCVFDVCECFREGWRRLKANCAPLRLLLLLLLLLPWPFGLAWLGLAVLGLACL